MKLNNSFDVRSPRRTLADALRTLATTLQSGRASLRNQHLDAASKAWDDCATKDTRSLNLPDGRTIRLQRLMFRENRQWVYIIPLLDRPGSYVTASAGPARLRHEREQGYYRERERPAFDPAKLKRMRLSQLQELVRDRLPTIRPDQTKAELVAHLSMVMVRCVRSSWYRASNPLPPYQPSELEADLLCISDLLSKIAGRRIADEDAASACMKKANDIDSASKPLSHMDAVQRTPPVQTKGRSKRWTVKIAAASPNRKPLVASEEVTRYANAATIIREEWFDIGAPDTLFKAIGEGHLPADYVGGKWRFHLASVLDTAVKRAAPT